MATFNQYTYGIESDTTEGDLIEDLADGTLDSWCGFSIAHGEAPLINGIMTTWDNFEAGLCDALWEYNAIRTPKTNGGLSRTISHNEAVDFLTVVARDNIRYTDRCTIHQATAALGYSLVRTRKLVAEGRIARYEKGWVSYNSLITFIASRNA